MIAQPELRKLALIPLAITLFVYISVMGTAGFFVDDVLAAIWTQPESGWLQYVWYALIPVIFLVLVVLVTLTFVSIAGVVSGPFYEKMVIHVLGNHGLAAEEVPLIPSVLNEVVRSVCFLVPAVVLAVIGFIPGVGLPFAAAGTAMGWLGLASNAVTPALAVTGSSLGDQMRFPFSSLTFMLGLGMTVGVSLLVPVLGLLSIPSAVIGVTDAYARQRMA